MNRLIALDIETYDPNLHELGDGSIRKDGRILCCGAHGDGISKVFDFDNPNDIQELRDILKDPGIDKIYHNGIGYDLPWLYCGYDMVIKGVQHDTMTRAALIDEYQSLGLDDCCRKLGLRGKNKDETIEAWYEKWQAQMKLVAKSFKKYGISDNNEVIVAKENNDFETWKLSPAEVEALITQSYKKDVWANALVIWADPVGREMMKKYNLQDCVATFNLFKAQEKLIEPLHNVYEMECKLVPILLDMKKRGIRVDEKRMAELAAKVQEKADEQERKLIDMYGVTGEMIASGKKLGARLNEMGIHSPIKTATGAESWAEGALVRIHHPVIPMIQEYKNYDSILNKYLRGSLSRTVINGRIHCTFLPMLRDKESGMGGGGTVTGRFSCLATGTMIFTTEEGYIPIETVQSGMHTITHTGKIAKIKQLLCNGIRPVYLYDNIICTKDHKIWDGNQFKEAQYVNFKSIPQERGTLQDDLRRLLIREQAKHRGFGSQVQDYCTQYTRSLENVSDSRATTFTAWFKSEQSNEYRIKCYAWQMWRAASQLQGCHIRWPRQSDDKAQWPLYTVLQESYGRCDWDRPGRSSISSRSTSCRWEQTEQRLGQSDTMHKQSSWQNAQEASGETEGLSMGNVLVWDLEIDHEDHSFLANGYFVHNCKAPNLQQIPARNKGHGQDFSQDMRSLFLPEEGKMIAALDYSQIEAVLLGHYAQGQQAVWFREQLKAGADLHNIVMGMTGITYRPVVKTFNYGCIYGMGWKTAMEKNYTLFEKLAAEEGLDIETFTKDIYYNYHKKFPVIKDTMEWCQNIAKAQGYIDTMGGRRQHKPKPAYDPATGKINDFIYKMLNKLIQGTAADILKTALINAYEAGIYDVLDLHLLVHDEQVVSVPFTKEGCEATVELQQTMANVYKDQLLVPIKAECELGPNWGYWSSRIYKDMQNGIFNPAEFNADYRETH